MCNVQGAVWARNTKESKNNIHKVSGKIQQGKTKKMGRREQMPEELMGGQMPGREWERSDGRKMLWALMEGEIPGQERERSEEWKMPRGLMRRANAGARAGEVGRKENAAGMDGEANSGRD
ncbi:hypothetical protein B0H14DRAFT_2574378 [Mycena olivaceomarginata]|nr:hypothetical protein B0H14DRAFT_2574378 [Mycena olivaceomarginata]